MKKKKPIVIKSITTAVSAGILASSCTNGYSFIDSFYGPHADNTIEGISILNINESNLSDEFINKLKLIQRIVNTVVYNKKEARTFADNPHDYLATKEIDFDIELSDAEKRLLLALADKDIFRAVKSKNIEYFWSLCSERGYIGIINEYNMPKNIRAMFKTDEDYDTFMNLIDSIDNYYPTTKSGVVGVPVAVVAGAVVYMGAAILYAAALYVTVGIEGLVAIDVGFAVNESVYVNSERSERRSEIESITEPVIRIWTDNNGLISSSAFYSELIDKQTDLFMELVERELANSSFSMEAIRNIIKIQFEGYYGLRK